MIKLKQERTIMDNEEMTFPNTFSEFVNLYKFKDTEEIYTNGSDLIPVFRVMQWMKHIEQLLQ